MDGRVQGLATSQAYAWRQKGIKTGAVVDSGILLYGFYYAVTTPLYWLLGTPIAVPFVWYAAEMEHPPLFDSSSGYTCAFPEGENDRSPLDFCTFRFAEEISKRQICVYSFFREVD